MQKKINIFASSLALILLSVPSFGMTDAEYEHSTLQKRIPDSKSGKPSSDDSIMIDAEYEYSTLQKKTTSDLTSRKPSSDDSIMIDAEYEYSTLPNRTSAE